MKRYLFVFAKAAVTISLLYFAFQSANVASMRLLLAELDFTWLAVSGALLLAQLVLASVRWRIIAASYGLALSPAAAGRYTLIGAFFNQALPSTIGGDALRAWLGGRTSGEWKRSIFSVLTDRVVGLLWLSLMVFVCLPWSLQLIQNPIGSMALAAIGIGSIVGIVCLFAIGRRPISVLQRWRPTAYINEIAQQLLTIVRPGAVGLSVMGISILMNLLTVFAAWFVARSTGEALSMVNALLLILPVMLIASIPISIAGWGVREGAMVAAFSYAGLSKQAGLNISLLFGATIFAVGMIGGIVWMLSREPKLMPQDGRSGIGSA